MGITSTADMFMSMVTPIWTTDLGFLKLEKMFLQSLIFIFFALDLF